MNALRLSASFAPNPRVEPLLDGTVQPEGIELVWESGLPGALHGRHLLGGGPDVFEFFLSNFIITRERSSDRWDWLLLPIFASRATLGLKTLVNVNAGIQEPADLVGARFGIPDYTMTAGLWFRAVLRRIHDVDTTAMEWHVARAGSESNGQKMGFLEQPPRAARLVWSSPHEVDRNLQAGAIDAAFPAADIPITIDTDRVRPLFDDGGRTFFADFRAATGFVPGNHVVCMKRRLAEEHPWVVRSVYEAFVAAKKIAFERDRQAAGIFRSGNHDIDWQATVYGADPFPYGLTANLDMLQMAAEQSQIDGLTSKVWDLADFVPAALSST